MNSLKKINNLFKELLSTRKDAEIPAFLGNLAGTVKADESSNVYAVLFNGEVVTVRNVRVPNVSRLPVVIGYDASNPTVLQVLRARNTFVNPIYPDVPNHADVSHTWPGYDTTWVRGEQFLPGLVVPATGLTVEITGYVYYLGGWAVIPDQTIDFSTLVVDNGAVICLVEIDSTGILSTSFGEAALNREALEYSDIPIPTIGKKPLFAVKLYAGQTEFIKNTLTTDIIDLRWTGFSSGAIDTLSANWDVIVGREAGVTAIVDTLALTGDGFRFGAGGRLAVVDSIDSPLIIGREVAIYQWWVYLADTGTSGSTIIDILKNGVSVFTDPADRPEIAFDDADGKVLSVVADVVDFAVGDIVTCDIAQVAVGASDLSIVGSVLIPVTVTSSSMSKVEGDADPVFGYSSSLDITFTGALTREAGETVGTYNMLIGTLAAPVGYSLIFISDTFQIAGDLTISAVTVIDTYSTNVAAHIIDGDDLTQWVSNTHKPGGVWFKLDFGAGHYVFRRIRFLQATTLAAATRFKVEQCNDVAFIDEFWESLGTITMDIADGEYILDTPTGAAGRYLRFTCLGGDSGSGWEVFEVSVKGW